MKSKLDPNDIENYLEELVEKGHARVVGLTESGRSGTP
jgi:hypothetical protein